MRNLPSGTVTFLFTDVEGSTRLLHELGAERYAAALLEHRRVIREACVGRGGVEVDTQGDAFFIAFPTAPGALEAAVAVVGDLEAGPIRVRIGVHTGTPLLTDEGYVGPDVNRAARIAAAGHGGQILVSGSTARLTGHELLDLGEHRFKDLAGPERVYQVGNAEHAPLKSLYRTNLPVPASEFVGRANELADVTELLGREEVRLLTFTGPGGTGKTRLALQAVAEVADRFPGGVWFIPLAPIHDAALAVPALMEAMGSTGDVAAALAGRRALVVLDNAEHLLPRLVEELDPLRAADGPTLVVTSRERLRLSGEHVWPVPPLDERDGPELFVARARAIDPSFQRNGGVEELCERLEQLPLALELAAARTPLFTPHQLLERLGQRLDLLRAGRDADPRQRTLRATIEWSHDLLSPEEQRLFRRLAVFVGGCSFESSEDVCGSEPDVLQSLIDKSLVRRRDTAPEPRFWMLETIREFAVEQLSASGEQEHLARRHAEHFATFGDRFDAASGGPGSDLLEAEAPDLRAALAWSRAARDGSLVVRLATGGHQELWFRDSLREIRDAIAEGLELAPDDKALRCRALLTLAFATYRAGDHEASRSAADEAAELARGLGDERRLAGALSATANLLLVSLQHQEARQLLEEAAELFRRSGDRRGQAVAAVNLGDIALVAGDYEGAMRLSSEGLELFAAIDDATGRATALMNLATACVYLGRFAEAKTHAGEGVQLSQRLDDLYGVGCGLQVAAAIAAGSGEGARAARLLGAADALREHVGAALEPSEQLLHDHVQRSVSGLLEPAARQEAYASGRSIDSEDAVTLAIGEWR